MIRILHVTAAGERGGLEVVLLTLLKHLDRSRFESQVAILESGPFVREVEESGIKVYCVPSGRVRNVVQGGKAVSSLVRLIRDDGIDIVHSHNAKAHLYGGLSAQLARVPGLFHLHGVPRPSLSPDGLVSSLSVLLPARITVACSSFVSNAFAASWHSNREIRVIHNGVVSATPVSTHPPIRAEFGISTTGPLVVMVTRLEPWKGVHTFLEAASRVLQSQPQAVFMVVGGALFGLSKEYPLYLRNEAKRLKLDGSVVFTGFRSDVIRFFQEADIVVHGSLEPDPFPTVLLEAMACRKPVVASDAGGPREIVEHGVTGLLVPPGKPEAQAEAIIHLIKDPSSRIRMGEAGGVRVLERFHVSRMSSQFESLYAELARQSV